MIIMYDNHDSILTTQDTKLTKGLEDLSPVEMDYLVMMGCEETCPAVLAKKIIEWQIPDPKGKSVDVFREVRDIIENRVKALFEEIGKNI
jgi:protein-tyrosine-phosphatase